MGVAVTLVALGAVVSVALSRTGFAPTLRAASTFVVFDQHVSLTGTAPPGRVTLYARHFGDSTYKRVARTRVRDGRFHFSPVPGIATTYKVSTGTVATQASRPVRVYVHLDVTRFSCSLCIPGPPPGRQQLHYALIIRVPASDYRFVLSEPVYLYVGAATAKVRTEKRVAQVKPNRVGRSTVKVSGSIAVDVPAGGRVRFTACDRSAERRTGVGLPWIHDCGRPQLSHSQFTRYVG